MALRQIYSTQFIAWSADPTPPSYVVPAGYVAVVRDISVTWGGGAMIFFQTQIAAGAVFSRGMFTAESVPQEYQWRGRVVCDAGQAFAFTSDGAVDGVISGYLLVVAA